MKEIKKGPLFDFLIGRTSLTELILVAVLISFSVNIISGSLTLLKWFNPYAGIFFGIVICSLSIMYLIVRTFGKRVRNQKYEGFFIYSKIENTLIRVQRYDISEFLSSSLNSAFVENSALKLIWDKEPVNTFFKFDKKKKKVIRREPRSSKLLKELIEYYILEKLSTHLTDYFNKSKLRKENIYEFTRNEIPDVLLSNRFLELFSKPMDERPIFAENAIKGKGMVGETIVAYGCNGASYQKFDLVLPRKSKIKRLKENQIQIKTKRFTMVLSVEFEGTNTMLPNGFEEYYLSRDKFNDISVFDFQVSVHMKFNIRSIFSIKGWEYYHWIDSFLKTLDDNISKQRFFEIINWESVLTVIHCSSIYNKVMQQTACVKEIVK